MILISALTKIGLNQTGWKRPDGAAAGPFGSQTGFQMEDWLARGVPDSTISDWMDFTDSSNPLYGDLIHAYAHLAGILKSIYGSESTSFQFPSPGKGCLGLVCNNRLVGYFRKVSTVPEAHAVEAIRRLKCGTARVSEAGTAAWPVNGQTALPFVNIRFEIDAESGTSDLVLFENPISLSKGSGKMWTGTDGTNPIEIPQFVVEKTLNSSYNGLFE